MKLSILKHRKAKRDALQAFVFIGQNNLDAAERFLTALNNEIHELAAMPGMGAQRSFSDPKLKDIRSWPISGFRNYLIFYRYNETEIQILRVIHGARDIERVLVD